jgi:endoglucanase
VDDIQSYSTNEVAINWNSALAWAASFLADQRDGAPLPPATCRVDYTVHGTWPGGFVTQVTVTNTGVSPVNGWTVDWSFTGNQALRNSWSVDATEQGATVSARNLSWNSRIDPGRSVTFGFVGSTSLANPAPELFTLNGSACRTGP